MNTKSKSTTVLIIDDDDISLRCHRASFAEDRPDVRLSYCTLLSEAMESVRDFGFIFIDLSAVDGRTFPCFKNSSYIGNLQNFVEKHRSSFIIIMSAMVHDAEEDIEDLKVVCPDSRLFVIDPCGRHDVDPLVAFVNKYSPERIK